MARVNQTNTGAIYFGQCDEECLARNYPADVLGADSAAWVDATSSDLFSARRHSLNSYDTFKFIATQSGEIVVQLTNLNHGCNLSFFDCRP